MRAVDISNWQGEINLTEFTCWRNAGVGHVIVRASMETLAKRELAQRQMRGVLAAQMGLSPYVWCYWDWDPVATIDGALELMDGMPFHTLWLDVEEEGNHPGAAAVTSWLIGAIRRCAERNVKGGIYTGKWWWDKYHMPPDFALIPLWTAQYDGLENSAFTPYGGWTACAMKQYTSEGQVCSSAPLDLNWADEAYFGGDDMADYVTREDFNRLAAQVQRNQDADYVRALLAEFRDDDAITKIQEMKAART